MDRTRTRNWAIAAVIAGVALMRGLELYEEPDLGAGELLLELIGSLPVVLTAGSVLSTFPLEDLLAPIEGIE
jgi:hypothetical protein